MNLRRLGHSEIEIKPLILGGNVFGWTIDEKVSFDVLDAYIEQGFSAIDTADSYSHWVPGNSGGESERIIGKWMKARGNRDQIMLATKLGSKMGDGKEGLSAAYMEKAVEDSLKRLQTDHIDLYQSHHPDPKTQQEETLAGYDRLIRAGKVRAIGASNYDAALMQESVSVSVSKELPRYDTLQNEYNLYTREHFEGAIQDLVVREGISGIPYYGLASGFLTGKYRSEADFGKSPRGQGMGRYLDEKGRRILAALDAVSAETDAALAEISIAWIIAQPGIAAPIASATSRSQVESLARGARLQLSAKALEQLTQAGKA